MRVLSYLDAVPRETYVHEHLYAYKADDELVACIDDVDDDAYYDFFVLFYCSSSKRMN